MNCFTAPLTIGPRQTTACVGSTRNPIDITFTPQFSIGMRRLFSIFGFPVMPIIRGMLGPYISRSTSPTFAPSFARATARLTDTVDFPTPPFPEATAIVFFTPARIEDWSCPRSCCITFEVISTRTSPTPSIASRTARTADAFSSSRTGQAGVVSSIVKLTSFPVIDRPLTN